MGYFRDIWDRSKDGSRHEQRSFVRYAIVATLIMVVFLLVKKDNLLRWVEAGFTIAGRERKIEKLRVQTRSLEEQTSLLSHDRDTLEAFAREHLGFAEKGDDVYLVK